MPASSVLMGFKCVLRHPLLHCVVLINETPYHPHMPTFRCVHYEQD
jgi:hypothetical protein